MCSLHTTKTDSSRAVKTRKLLIVQFGEKSVFPYISLLDIVAIYNLTTHARLPFCPKFLLMDPLYAPLRKLSVFYVLVTGGFATEKFRY